MSAPCCFAFGDPTIPPCLVLLARAETGLLGTSTEGDVVSMDKVKLSLPLAEVTEPGDPAQSVSVCSIASSRVRCPEHILMSSVSNN